MVAAHTIDMASGDAQTALTEYETDFGISLRGMPDPWAKRLGKHRRTNALITNYPVSLGDAGMKELKGDPRRRALSHASIKMAQRRFQDGVEEHEYVVVAPDFFGWNEEPQNMAAGYVALPNELVSEELANGKATDAFDGAKFFSNNHPVSGVLGTGQDTYSNIRTGWGWSPAAIKELHSHFGALRGLDGRRLGLSLWGFLMPPEHTQDAKDFLDTDFISDGTTTIRNRHQNSAQIEKGDELREDNVLYAIGANNRGAKPWAVQQRTQDPEVIIHDKNSPLYKLKGYKVGVDVIAVANGGLYIPHSIVRLELA